MAALKINVQPFTTPNFVLARMPPRLKQDGFAEAPKWALSEIDADVLSILCDDFRAEIFRKARKPDPKVR